MATYTLEIDEKTTNGKQILNHLKSLNIKLKKGKAYTATQEKEAFLLTSKRNASLLFSKHL